METENLRHCFGDFRTALTEVDSLLDKTSSVGTRNASESTMPQPSDTEFESAVVKASIVLLAAKFEVFVEKIVQTFFDSCVKRGIASSDFLHSAALFSHQEYTILSQRIRELAVDPKSIRDNQKAKLKHIDLMKYQAKALQQLVDLWNPARGDEIEVKPNIQGLKQFKIGFSYGKHGAGALESLFAKIGIIDMFNKVPLSIAENTYLEGGVERKESYAGRFNSFTNFRNLIIHADSKGQLTLQQCREYRLHLEQFADQITQYLEIKLAEHTSQVGLIQFEQ